jgi:uncharacterized membrane protein/protein-disulfide isomerase
MPDRQMPVRYSASMTRHMRGWLLGFALLGLMASVSSGYVHYKILRDPTYTPICDVNQTLSCETAYTSQYGTIRGVPIAVGGVIWFALVTILLLGAKPVAPQTDARHAKGLGANVSAYLFVLSTIALGGVLFLAYVSFFILKTVCVFCLLTYVAVIGLYVLSGRASDAPLSSIPRRALADLRTLVTSPLPLIVALLFSVGSVAAIALFPRDTSATVPAAATPSPLVSDQQTEFERWFSSQARESLAVPSDGAKVVVVKFNDFQCPACADSYFKDKDVLAKYLSSYPRDVRFVLVDYPLAPECNSSVTAVVHPAACAGAVAVRLARMNGKDTEMQEWLYSNQQGLTRDAVRQAAQNIAGVRNFDQEYARQLALVRQDAEMGGRLKIDGTPTFFINGVRVPGALRAEYLDAAIMHELRRAGVAIP